MPIYNKLVRDRIPEIIEKSGSTYSSRVLDETEYKEELRKKLSEEVEEYLNAMSNDEAIEELADVMELIHALAVTHGSTIEEVEKVRVEKAQKRGGFEEKIYLVEVHDES
ncbi:phosphoribosyl-ATP pyrophosphohydrolase [Chungangia koreensis]|uniref:Phosphoribosyl-ATP pyrophosphohydrolase n=1 Tax=Chungangia koreensis TaxID=752657 RepID=A0ABV8X2Y0_9LACT